MSERNDYHKGNDAEVQSSEAPVMRRVDRRAAERRRRAQEEAERERGLDVTIEWKGLKDSVDEPTRIYRVQSLTQAENAPKVRIEVPTERSSGQKIEYDTGYDDDFIFDREFDFEKDFEVRPRPKPEAPKAPAARTKAEAARLAARDRMEAAKQAARTKMEAARLESRPKPKAEAYSSRPEAEGKSGKDKSKDSDSSPLKATLSVTLIVFISKAVGFLRDMITAYYFGTSAQSDAYNAAYSLYYIPILLFTSCITSTMVPLYLGTKDRDGIKAANRFGSNCINLFAALSLIVSFFMMLFAEPLVRLVYSGYVGDERFGMTMDMFRIMLPSLIFVTVSIVQASIMNAREHYLAGQLSGFPYSIITIIAAVCFAAPYGIYAIAWATAIAGLLQMLIVIPFQKGIFQYSIRFELHDPTIKRMIVLAVPSMVSMAVNELNHLIDRSLAAGLNVGDVSAMNSAYRLVTFILGVITVPIITVMFSRMSKKAAENDRAGIANMLMQCVEVISMIMLPITALGMIFSLDLIKLVYMRGAFNINSATNTAWIFSMYLLGVLFYGLRDLFNRGFHSVQNTRVPLYTSMMTVALHIVLNLILSRVMGAGGLALSTSIASAVSVVALVLQLRKRLGSLHARDTLKQVGKMAFATAVSAAVAMELNRLVPEATGTLQIFFRLVLCGLPSLAVYGGGLYMLKVRQLDFIKNLIPPLKGK